MKMQLGRRTALLGIVGSACWHAPARADQPLERMRGAYASLRSYADKGTITLEGKNIGGPMLSERHSFATRFAAPRRFYFEFTKDPNTADERFVIWCPGETFSSWWSATNVAENYARGQGQNAFAVGEHPTSGAVSLIPPLLFANAGLVGPLSAIDTPTDIASETIAGRSHHVVTATVRLNHWSETTRTTRLWIDAQTMLVRRIFQDTPTGMGGDVVDRVTTVFEPEANPALDDDAFRFTPPG